MLLASGILLSAGGLLILIGSIFQALRQFYQIKHKHNPPGQSFRNFEEPGDFKKPGPLARWWRNSKWLSTWRAASILDARIFHAWLLIMLGAALVLAGSLLTAIAAA